MTLNIHLFIKFRAFRVTLLTLDKQFIASVGSGAFSINEVPVTPTPSGARVVVNERGVKLTVWSN